MFVRKGWDVYVSDTVERGRSGFVGPDVRSGEPVFLTHADPFERLRIGARKRDRGIPIRGSGGSCRGYRVRSGPMRTL